jgi:hypothetical protein
LGTLWRSFGANRILLGPGWAIQKICFIWSM